MDYDAGTNLVPRLADAMPTVSADGKTYTFKIHKDVNFHNARRHRPAPDDRPYVAASINRILNLTLSRTRRRSADGLLQHHRRRGRLAVLADRADRVGRSRSIDPTTIEFDSGQCRCDLPQRARHAVRLGRAQELAGDDADGLLGQSPSGPGRICSRVTPRARAPPSSRTRPTGRPGQPYLDQIDYKTGQDDNAMLLQI